MKMKRLGRDGPMVSDMGLGCNGMSLQKPRDDDESIATLQAALDNGLSFLDTADFYGMGHNESLIARAINPAGTGHETSLFRIPVSPEAVLASCIAAGVDQLPA